MGFGVGPIWWQTIQDYCKEMDLDEDQTEAMHLHVKALDTVYIKDLMRKNK